MSEIAYGSQNSLENIDNHFDISIFNKAYLIAKLGAFLSTFYNKVKKRISPFTKWYFLALLFLLKGT